jgi:adenine phosphoribosyltransferase
MIQWLVYGAAVEYSRQSRCKEREETMDPRTTLLRDHIRDVPDFPKPGVMFKDITPLLAAPQAFAAAVELFVEHFRPRAPTAIAAIESRGFIFGGPVALALDIPLHIIRKRGKLPWKTDFIEYSLEYGTDALEIHQETLGPNDRVLIMDDLLATGGTAAATVQLCQKQGAEVIGCAFVVELAFLSGREKLGSVDCHSLVTFD